MIDQERFDACRAELMADATDNWAGIARVRMFARELLGLEVGADPLRVRDTVLALLSSLVGHPDLAVVTGYTDREYTDLEVLREAVLEGWAEHDGRPLDGKIAWLVDRGLSKAEPLGPGERPDPRDMPFLDEDTIELE